MERGAPGTIRIGRSSRRSSAPKPTRNRPARQAVHPALQSGDALCAINAQYRIVGWNRGAEDLFGLPEKDALGRACYEVIGGRDPQGSPVCGRNCLPMQLALRGRVVGALELDRAPPGSEVQALTCTTLTCPTNNADPAAPLILHLFKSNHDRQKLRSLLETLRGIVQPAGLDATTPAAGGQPDARLTGRELEVLGLVRAGLGTTQIATRLFLSPQTVRTHIQNIRGKLQVRNRLQAVAAAERRGLI